MTSIDQTAPAKVVGKIVCRHAVEASYPILEPTVVDIDVLYVIDLGDHPIPAAKLIVRRVMPISRAAAPSALPLSVQRTTSLARRSFNAAPMCTLSAFSRTKSAVLPVQSRQIRTGICSSDTPRFEA